MEAFHSFWSEPNRCRNGGEIRFPDYEQLTAILSALEWKRHSGPIRMVTDTPGAALFSAAGLDAFWDGTETTLDRLNGAVDPIAFWAAGKLWALKSMHMPCAMLDTDLILWDNVEALLKSDVVAAHAEALNPRTYPSPSRFLFRDGYTFPDKWDFDLKAANTAFLYLRDDDFRDCYVRMALDFMNHVEPGCLNPVQTMCFAEQRILPMCAKAEGRTLSWLMETGEVFRQNFATHTWGFKRVLRTNAKAREEFCMRCVRRVFQDFPEQAEMLFHCRDLAAYACRCREAKNFSGVTDIAFGALNVHES